VSSPVRHALTVATGFALLFAWLFAYPSLHHGYLAESDLYEFFLPTFLSPITLWSSFEFGGTPSFADPSDTSLYPLHLLARAIGSWFFLIAAAYVVAACGMYAYVYSLTRSKTAALFSALAYPLSEAMMERLAHLGVVQTMSWLPWIALALDRLRGPRPWRWMVIGALLVGCCFLAGNPQTFLYAGYLFGVYALCGAVAENAGARTYVATAGMAVLGALLASVKTLPLLEASLYTARQAANYDVFVSHANTPAQMLSAFFPTILHEGREAPTYVGIATLVFAVAALRSTFGNWRIPFWAVVVAVALLIGAGDATPLARLAYKAPFYDKFRVVGRHLIFAAFGLATLAGIGVAGVSRRAISRRAVASAAGVVLLAVSLAAAMLVRYPGMFEYEDLVALPWRLPLWNDRIWLQIVIAIAAVTASILFAAAPRSRPAVTFLLLMLFADLVNALPYPLTWSGLKTPFVPVDAALHPSVYAARLGRDLEPQHQRLLAPGGTQIDSVIPAVFARVWKIPIAGGYGPMLLRRYSDLALMGSNGSVRPGVLGLDDAALDLLAVRYILVRPDNAEDSATIERSGVRWDANELDVPVGRPDCGHEYARSTSIPLPPDVTVASIALVTHLRCDENVPQGAEVVRLRVTGTGGIVHEQSLRAGVDTAETAFSGARIVKRARHQVPSNLFDDPSAAPALRFLTRVTLPHTARGGRLEFDAPATYGWITIDRLTLIDDTGAAHPLSAPRMWLSDSTRWREVTRFATSRLTDRGVDQEIPGEIPYVAVENLRALPRAWVVSKMKTLADADALEAIRRSQLPDGARFNPREMALVSPNGGPPSDGPFPTGVATAQVEQISDGRITVSVSTGGGGFLVLSEAFYPGWHARIDDVETPVYLADAALQGVIVPAGRHLVHFEFTSRMRRGGAALSLFGIACVAVIFWRTRSQSHTVAPPVP